MEPAFVFSTDYDFVLPEFEVGEPTGNVKYFDGTRASRAWRLLLERFPQAEGSVLRPEPVADEDLLLVHDAAYLASLAEPRRLAEIFETPMLEQLPVEALQRFLVSPQRCGTGGTLLAVRTAFEHGLAVNFSGGYHHAKRGSAEGFCLFADLALGVHVARRDCGIQRVAIVDLDAHQGNGTSSLCIGDADTAIFDVYNAEIYPNDLPARAGLHWDHPLLSGCTGAAYLALLERELPHALDEFEPELVLYNAGTDIVASDPLGLFQVSPDEVTRRDQFVFQETRRREIPTVVTASGGYTDLSHQLLAELACQAWER